VLREFFEPLDRCISIIDLGCGKGYTVRLLSALGFGRIHGVDFRIGLPSRAWQVAAALRRKGSLPYKMQRCDIRQTGLPSASFDAVLSVSTIEHGFDPPGFLFEASRFLRPDGLLFVTTDYWDPKNRAATSAQAFGFPWEILCRSQIESFVSLARSKGLTLFHDEPIPPCAERPVSWNGQEYTFIAMAFRKLPRGNESKSRFHGSQEIGD